MLLAYEMNGEPLPPDHGFPVRLVVPSWIGISSIKWVGEIEVSAQPLFSPWNTQFYRLFGPDYPAEGSRRSVARWSRAPSNSPGTPNSRSAGPAPCCAAGPGPVTDGSGTSRSAPTAAPPGAAPSPAAAVDDDGWQRWEFPWRPRAAGPYDLLARATDVTGARQPDAGPYNTLGYLFGAVVRHPVTVA